MLINKVLEDRLDISDVNELFTSNYDGMILKNLAKKYKGKCFKSMLITDIVRIIRRGKIECKPKVLDGSAYVDVMFEVTGIVYEENEVIHNCKIIRIDSGTGTMHALSEHAVIQINNSGANIYKEGERIPVMAKMTRYYPFKPKIAVAASPLVPTVTRAQVFKVTATNYAISESEMEKFNTVIKELEDIKKLHKKIYDFFVTLLFPYKKDPIASFKKIQLSPQPMKEGSEGYIYIPPTRLNEYYFHILTDGDLNSLGEYDILDSTYEAALNHVLYEMIKKAYQLKSFIENYNTIEQTKSISHVLKMYQTLKV